MMKNLSKDQKGFTLLELLIAISLLAVGLLAATSMQGVALNSNALSNRVSTGSMIAQMVMDDICSWPRTRLQGGGGDYDLNPDPGAPEMTRSLPGSGTYAASYTITPNTPINGVSRIEVMVTRMNDEEHSLSLATNRSMSIRGENRIVILTGYKRTMI